MNAHSRPSIQISPSLMCVDFLRVQDELDVLEKYKTDWLHIDVMDGHYVPNFALGIDFCRSLAVATSIPFDIHLMVERPDLHIEAFTALPRARITFHPETVRQPVRLIERIRERGASPGIAIDPAQPIEQLRHLIPLVDQVTVMTVNPGYAGQKLIPYCLDKIAELRRWLDEESLPVTIEVDGNVSWQNIPKMTAVGADILVVGTSCLFEKHRTREESFRQLRALVDELNHKRLALAAA